MLQQTLLRNRRINPRQQFGVSHCGSPLGAARRSRRVRTPPISCRALYQTLVCFACITATPGPLLAVLSQGSISQQESLNLERLGNYLVRSFEYCSAIQIRGRSFPVMSPYRLTEKGTHEIACI